MGIRSFFFYLFIFCMVNVPFQSSVCFYYPFLCHFYFPISKMLAKCIFKIYFILCLHIYRLYTIYNIQGHLYTHTHTPIYTHSGSVVVMVTHKRLSVHQRKRAYSVFLCHRERMVKIKGEHTPLPVFGSR